MDRQSDSHEPTQPTVHLKIANRQNLRQFLKEIQQEFLHVVNPRESGLVDILYGAKLLTETDHESLSGKDVHIRKDQARKLWILLNKMPVPDFLSTVAPVLLEHFPHIIPCKFVTQEAVDSTDSDEHNYCLHHDIKGRIRADTMADLLYQQNHLGFDDYEDIASGEFEADIVWTKMFESCVNPDPQSTSQLVEGVQTLMERYKVDVPGNLGELVSCGVPCTCRGGISVLPASSPFPLRKVGSWVRKSPFGRHSLRSSGSSYSRADLKSYSAATSIRDDDSQSLSSEPISTFPAPHGSSSEHLENLSPVQEEGEEPSLLSSISFQQKTENHSVEEVTSSTNSEVPTIRNSCTNSSAMSRNLEMDVCQSVGTSLLGPEHEATCAHVEQSEPPRKSTDLETVCIPMDELALSCDDHEKPEQWVQQAGVDSFFTSALTYKKFLTGFLLVMITGLALLIFLGSHVTTRVTATSEFMHFLDAMREIVLNHEQRLTQLQNVTIVFRTAILNLYKTMPMYRFH